jgi:hypothetical protein
MNVAYLPILADRYGACVRQIYIRGLDLTELLMRAQVRLGGDVPGAPLVDLQTVTNGNAEGLRLVDVISDEGTPVSHIEMVINETTIEGLPYAGELGSATALAWDWQVTFSGRKQRIARGEFIITGDGVTGADNAPANRAAAWARSTSPTAGMRTGATLTFGDEVMQVTIDSADLVAAQVDRATAAQDRAEDAQLRADLSAGAAQGAARYFTTRAAGEAASAVDQAFATDDGAGNVIYYRRTAGGSSEIGRAVTPAGLSAADGADRVGAQAPGAGALSETALARLNKMNGKASSYGVSVPNTPANNLAALKNLVATLQPGDTIEIDGSAVIDTTGGIQQAAEISQDGATVIVRGTLSTNYGTMNVGGSNPPALFNVTGDSVRFAGSGILKGHGATDSANAGTSDSWPQLIRVLGNDFVFDGPMIDSPSKMGIVLVNALRARIRGTFKGGLVNYTPDTDPSTSHTGYHAIAMTGGGYHDVSINLVRSAAAGRFITGVFNGGNAGGANHSRVHGCKADVHEKLYYGDGASYCTIETSEIENAIQTDTVRMMQGNYNIARSIIGRSVKGGVAIYDGNHNEVLDCHFFGLLQAGLIVQQLSSSYTGGFDGTRLLRNEMWGDGTSTALDNAIKMVLGGANTQDIKIDHNFVRNFAPDAADEALILVQMLNDWTMTNLTVDFNDLGFTSRAGVVIRRALDYSVSENRFRAINQQPIVTASSSGGRFYGNTGRGIGIKEIAGFDPTVDEASNNQWSATPLKKVITVAAGATYTVLHDGLAVNATVRAVPLNDQARLLVAVAGEVSVTLTGDLTGVVLALPNGTPFAGGERYRLEIDQ